MAAIHPLEPGILTATRTCNSANAIAPTSSGDRKFKFRTSFVAIRNTRIKKESHVVGEFLPDTRMDDKPSPIRNRDFKATSSRSWDLWSNRSVVQHISPPLHSSVRSHSQMSSGDRLRDQRIQSMAYDLSLHFAYSVPGAQKGLIRSSDGSQLQAPPQRIRFPDRNKAQSAFTAGQAKDGTSRARYLGIRKQWRAVPGVDVM
jgi:hypothetical protein